MTIEDTELLKALKKDMPHPPVPTDAKKIEAKGCGEIVKIGLAYQGKRVELATE